MEGTKKGRKDRSVGIVLFHDGTQREYLMLARKRSSDFPKGHPEKGEDDMTAALRETREETGISDVELIPGFSEETRFSFGKNSGRVKKTVRFFLGRAKSKDVVLSKEHIAYEWITPKQAETELKFENQKELIRKAEQFLAR